jgi:DNA-binding PadR family transcriptional regulator
MDRELKRGAAELLILSLLDARPRHGYELGKLIHTRSGGQRVPGLGLPTQMSDALACNWCVDYRGEETGAERSGLVA